MKITGLRAIRLPNREIVLIGREGDNLTLTISNDSPEAAISDATPPFLKIEIPDRAVPPANIEEIISASIRESEKRRYLNSPPLVWSGAEWQPDREEIVSQ